MADSWLTDGNCSECRRQSYCSKPCKKASLRRNRAIYNSAMRHTGMAQLLDKFGSGAKERFEDNLRASGFKI